MLNQTLIAETCTALRAAIRRIGSPDDRLIVLDAGQDGTPILLRSARVESATAIAREALAVLAVNGVTQGGSVEAWWDGSQTRGCVLLVVPSDERLQLAEDLARWAGENALQLHTAVYETAVRHGTYCCAEEHEVAARDEYAGALSLPIDALRRRHAAAGAR